MASPLEQLENKNANIITRVILHSSVSLFAYQSICLSVCLSAQGAVRLLQLPSLPVCVFVQCMFVCPSVCLSVYLLIQFNVHRLLKNALHGLPRVRSSSSLGILSSSIFKVMT